MDKMRMYSTWYNKHYQTDEIFEKWMNEVEEYVFKQIGMYLLDIPDEDWVIWFTNGLTSEQAGKLVLKHNLLI